MSGKGRKFSAEKPKRAGFRRPPLLMNYLLDSDSVHQPVAFSLIYGVAESETDRANDRFWPLADPNYCDFRED